MKTTYWDVTDEQVIEKTGKPLAAWKQLLDDCAAASQKPAEVVAFLQHTHNVPRYWARTLTTHYFKNHT